MQLAHIVAVSSNSVIGANGGLPWHLREDLKYFKATTTGHAIIMGRQTFDSIGRALPGRFSIVLSHRSLPEQQNVQVISQLSELIPTFERLPAPFSRDKAFIIGGASIYKQTTDLVDEIYLTRVKATFEGDTFYQDPDSDVFELASEKLAQDGAIELVFQRYRRKQLR